MEPLEFLAVVLPSAGIYCAVELSTPAREHFFSTSLKDINDTGQKFSTAKKNTYYAMASFTTSKNRTAANALYMRSAFFDIDCGTGKGRVYANKTEAAQALDKFLEDTALGGMGHPWVISSGGGLHVYWPFTEDIGIPEWKATAENLKKLAFEQSLHIDMGVTADAARVMRLPGSHNWKRDKPCKILVEGDPQAYDFGEFSTTVRAKLNGRVVAVVPPVVQEMILGTRLQNTGKARPIKDNLLSNSATLFKNIIRRTNAGTGCEQLRHYVDNATDENMEELWRGLLTLAAKCDDGDKASIWLTGLHPYTEARMHTKIRQLKGVYKCTDFDARTPGICEKCPNFGKLENPLALGYALRTGNTEKLVDVSQDDSPTPVVLVRPTPPRGFSYGQHGGVYVDREVEDDKGDMVQRQFMILPYDLFAVDILDSNNEHTVHMMALRKEGPARVLLPQKCVVSKDDTIKALAAQNIMAAFGGGNDKNLFEYIRACTEEVSVNKKAIVVPSNYGWQEGGTFVYSGKVYSPTGEVEVPMPGLENLAKSTAMSGTLEGWRAVMQLLIDRKKYDILAMALVGFGSPLMRFSKYRGMTFHLGSSESSTGKTLTLELAASVWGHPTDYRVGKGTSGVAMQQRLGLLNSLPLITDEITSKNHKDFEWFLEFLFDMSEGRGKERMESGANKERLNLSTWWALALMSSNTHAIDYMTGGRKHSSEGELRRMLEKTMTEQLVWDSRESKILAGMQSNYGVAGDAYVKWLVRNLDTAREVRDQAQEKLIKNFNATNDERFWFAGLGSMVGAGELISSRHAGIIDMPMEPIIESYLRMVEHARSNIRANARTAEEILNMYTREYYGSFVVVRAIEGAVQATYGERGVIDESITKSRIAGRVEHGISKGNVHFFIEEKLLRSYCSSVSFGYADLKDKLASKFAVTEMKKDMLSQTKGPPMRTQVIRVIMPESMMGKDDEVSLPLG